VAAHTINRRDFLAASLAAPLGVAVARAQPSTTDRGFARIERFADGVYTTIADPAKGPQCLSNGGVLAGRDAMLLLEGHFQPAGAALEIEFARELSRRPIRAAVNTHFHLDHTFGNVAYAREDIPIIAHQRVPALMQGAYSSKGADHTVIFAPLEQRVAAASTPDEKQRFAADLAASRWMYGAIDRVELAVPTELISPTESRRTIDLGGLVAVLECHEGHTPGDLTVLVPDRGVMFVGDLLFYRSYPIAIDANMRAWRSTLERVLATNGNLRFVPGHGPLCTSQDIRAQIDLLDDLQQHANRMKAAGTPIDEAIKRYEVPPRFRDYEIFSWAWTIGAALKNYYAPVS